MGRVEGANSMYFLIIALIIIVIVLMLALAVPRLLSIVRSLAGMSDIAFKFAGSPLSDRQPRQLESSNSDLVSKSARVRQVRGKYAHLAMSSEAFAAQKQAEIKLEDRR